MSAPTTSLESPPPPQPTSRPPVTGRIVLGVLLVLAGLVWLVDAAGLVDVNWGALLPAGLVIVGVALIATARHGLNGGLVAIGIILTVLVLVSSVVRPVGVFSGIGERTARPTTAGEVETGYGLAMGQLTVDLRAVEVPRGTTIEAGVGMGELVVIVPDGVTFHVRADVSAGEIVVLGGSRSGVAVRVDETVAGDGQTAFTLDLTVGMGKIEVRQ
jgi:hypothetical protein